MSFLNKLDLMYWHDGIFLGAQITLNADMSVVLFFELYKDTISKTREKIDIQFIDIENLIITTNTKELLDNRGAGQINYAYIKAFSNQKEA